MKTSALRNAISIALFATLSGNAGIALAREPTPEATRADAEQEDGAGQGTTAASSPSKPASRKEATATELETVTVTGTRIRGGTTPSPVIAIGSEQIRQEGFADLGEVIRSLPQNFGGGQNPGVVTATGSGNMYNQNAGGGSSLNLRGIGPDATLTLLNGRRLAYGGLMQAVDISAIPVAAVDRVDIVADGASAIYGSDAVAGVGNVILKRDMEGAVVSARYGRASRGGLGTREYDATAGTTWSNGGLIATYRHTHIDPISVGQRSYTRHMDQPFVLYPGGDTRSGLLSAHQSLGGNAELRLDALRTTRDTVYYQTGPGIYYDQRSDSTTSFLAPLLEVGLARGWVLQVGGVRARDENIGRAWLVTKATGDSRLASSLCRCNDSRSYEISAEGPLLELGAGELRLAAGAGYRSNELLNRNLSSGTQVHSEDSSRFAYAEVNIPLLDSSMGTSLARLLELTAAARMEDYDSFGRVTTPKFGVIYAPGSDLTVKASWGRSFKAPTLNERYGSLVAYLVPPGMIGGSGYGADDAVLLSWGSNPGLGPERATTQTISVAFHPERLRGLEAELTWFDIDYRERVVQPFAAFGQVLSDPAVAEFLRFSPTPEEQARLLAIYSGGFFNWTGKPYDPAKVVIIGHGEYVNAKTQRIRGIDLSGLYGRDLGSGRLTLRGSASWLDSSQQNTSGQAAFDLAGTIFYPAKVRSRLGLVWASGGFTASSFANYTGGVAYPALAQETASFTTLDLVLQYATARRRSAGTGFDLAFSIQNLFDRAPPLYRPMAITDAPYDSTNYSAVGRFPSITASWRW
ncbi:TonB-dependent receptor [Stenotrophomonas sp. PS02297]|uniref:TonB-dependent receptor plug domain-containing protein n=1 Tax=Stenotrophomonas sp. PS02297 TaxID=2991423 RepID=UPI00249C9E37|nr:TonB-dependent receptor [Stenotrophomonas sp. PS02297]